MPVSHLLFAHPFTVDSVRAVVRELQAHSESGVGATLGVYSVELAQHPELNVGTTLGGIGQIILVKFDCATAAIADPPLRCIALLPAVSIVLEDDPAFAASPLGADSFGALGWVAPAPAAPLVPEESVLAPSTLVADPAAAVRTMIQVVITRTFGKP